MNYITVKIMNIINQESQIEIKTQEYSISYITSYKLFLEFVALTILCRINHFPFYNTSGTRIFNQNAN